MDEPRLLRPPTWLQRAFWSLQSLSWDDAVAEEESRRRSMELVAWIARYEAPGRRILDLGCGTGTDALTMAAEGFEVVGLDFSPGMLRRAARKARRHELEVVWRRSDLDRPLPMGEGAFGRVLLKGVLQCVESPAALLGEVHRVLACGGLLFLVVKARPGSGPSLKGRSVRSRLFAPLKALASRAPSLHPFEPAELRGLVEAAGLAIESFEWEPPWLRVVGSKHR